MDNDGIKVRHSLWRCLCVCVFVRNMGSTITHNYDSMHFHLYPAAKYLFELLHYYYWIRVDCRTNTRKIYIYSSFTRFHHLIRSDWWRETEREREIGGEAHKNTSAHLETFASHSRSINYSHPLKLSFKRFIRHFLGRRFLTMPCSLCSKHCRIKRCNSGSAAGLPNHL